MSKEEKNVALTKIANGVPFVSIGKSKFQIGKEIVHVRFCSTDVKAPAKYKFNINPNTLSANYELWVCGTAKIYYLMPVDLMREIYDNPSTYVDRTHPEIRVVSVDSDRHVITYAAGGVSKSLRQYFGVTMNDV